MSLYSLNNPEELSYGSYEGCVFIVHRYELRMKSVCPTCKSPLYLPNNNPSVRKWSVLCVRCHSIYLVSSGTVIGAWLRYSNPQQAVYQARIHLQTGLTKTVELAKQLNIDEPVVLITPLRGLGKLKPRLLIETQSGSSCFLMHPQQYIRRYQLYGAVGIALLITWLGLSLRGTIDVIVVVALVSGLAAAIAVSRVAKGAANNPQICERLRFEQRLLRCSDKWGQRLHELEGESSRLHRVIQRLLPYDESQLFRIGSLSEHLRERRHFEDQYHCLSELIECYVLAKDLIDTSVLDIQLTGEVPLDLWDRLLDFAQEIKHLEEQYQADD